MKLIGIHTESQNSGKTFLAVALADALARNKKSGSVVLVDADDTNNGAKTSFSLLSKKPLRQRGFKYMTLDDWKEYESDTNIAIIDTSRNPSNGIKSSLQSDCDLVLIPCSDDDKSYSAAEDALWNMKEAEVNFMIVPNCQGGVNPDKIRQYFKSSRAPSTINTIPDEPLAERLLLKGDLLADVDKGDDDEARQAINRFDQLAGEILQAVGI